MALATCALQVSCAHAQSTAQDRPCDADAAILSRITPPPQRVDCHANSAHTEVTSEWQIVASPTHASATDLLVASLAAVGLKLAHVANATQSDKVIVIGTPSTEPNIAALAGKQVVQAMAALPSTDEAYVLGISRAKQQVLALGVGRSGAFWSIQSLAQLISNYTSQRTISLPSCSVFDFPDTAVRGFRVWAQPVDMNNATWTKDFIDLMSSHKLNFAPLPANAWHSQPEHFGLSTRAADRTFLLQLKKHLKSRFVEMVPSFSFGSTTYRELETVGYNDISEGLWIKEEPFTVKGPLGLLKPVADPMTGLVVNSELVLNQSSGQPAHWLIHPAKEGRKGQCYVDTRNPPPSDSRGSSARSMRCDVFCKGNDGPCTGSPGFESAPIQAHAGDVLFLTAQVNVMDNCTTPNGGPGLWLGGEPCVPDDPRWPGCKIGAGTTIPKTGGKWKSFGVTLHTTRDVNVTIITRMKDEGSSTDNCSWSVAHPRVLRLNSALLNVLQTNDTDVNVSSSAGVAYTRGVDYEVIAPTAARTTGKDTDLWALYQQSLTNRSAYGFAVRSLPGGKLQVGDTVLVSYDVAAGAVGWGDYTSTPQAFGESGFYESSCAIIRAAIELAIPSAVMCGMDEVRGINRDSRSRRLGMGNGQMFAYAMNKLAACVHSAAAANGIRVAPLFWADMVSPLHNGGIYGYQESFGGYAGNSSLAIQYLDPSITLVPWFYGSTPAEIASLNGSDAVCEGRLGPAEEPARVTPLRWIGAAGSNVANVEAWAANLATSKHGIGLVGTEWHFTAPVLTALPATGSRSWNLRGETKLSCAVAHSPRDLHRGA